VQLLNVIFKFKQFNIVAVRTVINTIRSSCGVNDLLTYLLIQC